MLRRPNIWFAPAMMLILICFSGTIAARPVRIMPVGDSITFGEGGIGGYGGYRRPLYYMLLNAGYSIDFVGTASDNSQAIPDRNHEGHPAWRIDQIDANITGFLNAVGTPDIILLHIGTNDFGVWLDTLNAVYRLDALIAKIAALRPDTHIIVTNLLPRNQPQHSRILTEFNPFVEGIVEAHIEAGRLVSFLDMYPVVALSQMPDQLHPNQTGYNQMASAWFAAIKRVIEPDDDVPPAIIDAHGSESGDEITLTFNRRLDQTSAENVSNYAIDQGLSIQSAKLSAYGRVVTLITDPQTLGTTYTLTANGILDHVSPTPNAIAPNSKARFFPLTPSGYFNNVAESSCYTLVQSLEIQDFCNFGSGAVPYSLDYHHRVGAFDRVAYYLELKPHGGDLQYAWVSMDAFTPDPSKLGVPAASTGTSFQLPVEHLNIRSNVAGVSSGTDQPGNLEFWPYNPAAANAAGVPGASEASYDFGDSNTGSGNYGSMQIHDTSGAQTIIAFNRWGGVGGTGDIGIGNRPLGEPDWTFAQNAADFEVKRLQVLVRTTGDTAMPTLSSAQSDGSRREVTVRFSEPVRADTLIGSNFNLDQGVSVLGVEISEDLQLAILRTTLQPDAALTLTVNGVRDSSQDANQIAAGSTIAVTRPPLPTEVIANTGVAADGFELVYSLEIAATGNLNQAAPYLVDNSAVSDVFDRVAYYLELQQAGGPARFIWAALDPFTSNKAQLGVPTFASGARFQQAVGRLDVISNVPGVVNGSGLTGGNIEFWPTGYLTNNAAGVPGADPTTYDFGDAAEAGGSYGSMQIHNAEAAQTLLALNAWGADGRVLDIGIGNSPDASPDWTSAGNAGTYSKRTLHVMVRPTPPAAVPPEVLARVPGSADYELVYSLDIPANGNLSGGAGFAPYSIDRSAEKGSFSRVAYYLELQKSGDTESTFAWVSMDAFTADRRKIGIPNLRSGASFQQLVTNLHVVSNGGVTSGESLAGNLEFWPSDYLPANSLPVAGASETIYDFGDRPVAGSYGSMQVHNPTTGETIFAINRWGSTGNTSNELCVGIGPNSEPINGATDYTYANNAASFNLVRKLHVLVLPGDSPIGAPRFISSYASAQRDRVLLRFDRELSDTSAHPSHFLIDGGLQVTGARLMSGNREIELTTSLQTPGMLYTVSTDGAVTARSPEGTKMMPGAKIQFTAKVPPPALAKVPEPGYDLIYELDIPVAPPAWNLNPIPYSVDETQFGERLFDRVAYLLELDDDWIYVSFDAHTARISEIGIPTSALTPTPFQGLVSNMNVASNVSRIVTGTGIDTGNIEFWGGTYQRSGVIDIPNASKSEFDFGDRMVPGSYGSMQVHNHGASQTLFAYNDWASSGNGISEIGIGNNTAGTHPDWTAADNASQWTRRKLYILAHHGTVAGGSPPQILTHPCTRSARIGDKVTMSVTPLGSGPFTFQWRHGGIALEGQTAAWLEIDPVSEDDLGDYDVVVTAPNFASTTSKTATLVRNEAPLSPYDEWRLARGLTPDDGDLDDRDLDALSNLIEFALGTDPLLNDHQPLAPDGSLNGTPILVEGEGPTFEAVFVRRKDHGQAGSVEYRVEFSSDLRSFYASDAEPTVITGSSEDPDYELASIPFPELSPDGKPVRFFRVTVQLIP